MSQVILFGGGDGGGIIITEHGIKHIPPFDPQILRELAALAGVTRAAAATKNVTTRNELTQMSAKLTDLIVPQVEKITSVSLNTADGLVYFDPDGGFVCGSTGKHPPVPVGGPHYDALQMTR